MPQATGPIPTLMGIINTTPDSFYDGGHFVEPTTALNQAAGMVAAGAAIIDIGGESTRPGAAPIDITEEIRRTIPVIIALRQACPDLLISIDTRNAEVMREACAAGANIINDVSALTHDPAAMDAVLAHNAQVVLMHMQGRPETMQNEPHYHDVVAEVYSYLAMRIDACLARGIKRENIIADPGIGFGKTVAHNILLLKNLRRFRSLGCRILVGVSRKSLIGHLCDQEPPQARLPGSLALNLWAAAQGADMLRVHDVAETRQALRCWQAVQAA
jgi:dihydropteroate synthase